MGGELQGDLVESGRIGGCLLWGVGEPGWGEGTIYYICQPRLAVSLFLFMESNYRSFVRPWKSLVLAFKVSVTSGA
jgi:hypothetical protein